MNPIDIIKEALNDMQEVGKLNELPLIEEQARLALAALDRATIKVDDDEIDKMVLEDLTDDSHVGLGLTHEGALAIARTFLGRGLRIARDNWLKTSPWISVEERLPDIDEPVHLFSEEYDPENFFTGTRLAEGWNDLEYPYEPIDSKVTHWMPRIELPQVR